MEQHDLLESQFRYLSHLGAGQFLGVAVQSDSRSVQRVFGAELSGGGQVENQHVVRLRASEELALLHLRENLWDRFLAVVEHLGVFLLLEQEIQVQHVGRSQLEVLGGFLE